MLGKADTPANEGKQEGVQAETEGDKTLGKRKDPQEGGRTIQQRETRRGTMGDKTVRKAGTPSPKGNNQGYNGKHPREGVQQRETRRGTIGDKGRQDRRQGEHTFQQGESRRGTMGGTGRQDPPKGRRTIQQKETRRGTMGNGRQRETRKKGYNGRQYRRQDLGKADTPSNTKADTLRKPTPTVHCLKKCKIRPPTTKGNKKKDKLGDKLGDKKEDKLGDKGDKGDKTSGRWTHHPTQRNNRRETMGDKGETRPRESGRTMQHRSHLSRETMGGNKNQDFGKVDHPTQAHVGRQWETIGGNGRQWETMGNTWRQPETRIDKKGDKGRQDFGKADTPSNTGTHVGTMEDNSETRRREGGHTIQHRCTHAGRQWERMGSNGGPGETRPCKGGHTIQARERWKTTRGDKTLRRRTHHPTQTHIVGRQSETSGDKTSGRQTHHPTQAHVGRQWETMADKGEAREGRHTITGTHVERQSETKREDNTSGRQTHHPTQANVWGDNARQCAQWDRRGEKGRRDLGKADTPSNTGTHVGRQ